MNLFSISTMSEEKDKPISREKIRVTENIQLKTSQSEKIAEISKRIQEKVLKIPYTLNIVTFL